MTEPTEFDYTPERVRSLLRRLPHLHTPPAIDPDMPRTPPSHTNPGGWLEGRMAQHADIEWALVQLPQPTYEIVSLSYLDDLLVKDIAGLVNLDERTVYRHRRDGVRYMAWLLGWRDDELGYGPQHYAAVKRRIFGRSQSAQ